MTTATWPGRGLTATTDQLEFVRRAVDVDHLRTVEIGIEPSSGVPRLAGSLPSWLEVVRVGHAAALAWRRVRHDAVSDVVVDVAADDQGVEPAPAQPPVTEHLGDVPDTPDAVVVGAGIIGLAIADRLARSGLTVAVLEAGPRIAGETTAWNNGMVHPGHDPLPGTAKAALNVAGNQAWNALAADLDIPLVRHGSMVAAFTTDEVTQLDFFLQRARANDVPGAQILDGAGARAIEPRLSSEVRAALWTPTTVSIDPVQVSHALAGDLRRRGGTLALCTPVREIAVEEGCVVGVGLAERFVRTRLVINAAGVYADLLAATAGSRRYSIHPRRGTLVLFDPGPADRHQISVGPVPGPYSKGGGMTARPDGLTTGGPTSVEQPGRFPGPPTREEIEYILALGARLLPAFPLGAVVAVDSAVRAATYGEDFVIGAVPGLTGLVEAAGTQSPGVASAPAIAGAVAAELGELGWLPSPD